MPHVSKRKIKSSLRDELLDQLFGTFELAVKTNRINSALSDIFTDTEKLMISKRLAIILLLNKGVPQHVISEQLGVSSSTVTKMSLLVEIGKYDGILTLVKTKFEKKQNISDILERLILMGMPPRTGRGRWSHWGRFTPQKK